MPFHANDKSQLTDCNYKHSKFIHRRLLGLVLRTTVGLGWGCDSRSWVVFVVRLSLVFPAVCVDGVDGDVADGSEDESVLLGGDSVDDPEDFVGCE